MYTPFKMKGKSPMMKALIGKQSRLPEHLKAKILAAPESPTKMIKKSPAKAKTEAAKRLLKAVPNQQAYDKLSDIEKKSFNKAAKKAKLPMKKSPAKLAVNKRNPTLKADDGKGNAQYLKGKRIKRKEKYEKGEKERKKARKGGVKGAIGSMTQSMLKGPVEKKYTKKLGGKTKMLKGTTVFGKKVTKKGVKRAVQAVATGGGSEVARKLVKSNVGKRVIKGVKKAVKGVKKAVNSKALTTGFSRTSKKV